MGEIGIIHSLHPRDDVSDSSGATNIGAIWIHARKSSDRGTAAIRPSPRRKTEEFCQRDHLRILSVISSLSGMVGNKNLMDWTNQWLFLNF
jgi:hypothetical protein